MVLLDNSKAHELAVEFPGRIGMLVGLSRTRNPRDLFYALENGRYPVWSSNKEWSEALYWKRIEQAATRGRPPGWVAVPDVVADAALTTAEWEKWNKKLDRAGISWPRALVVQDGMTPDVARRLDRQPEVIFVGGTAAWKRFSLWGWCRAFGRVHVGRVNSELGLWRSAQCGAESCDGTGWFRGRKSQLNGLLRYLQRSEEGLTPLQMHLEYARTFGGNVPRRMFERHENTARAGFARSEEREVKT